jgi:hypothetical protein
MSTCLHIYLLPLFYTNSFHRHDELRADAESLADPSWNAEFYDSIAPYVVGYLPTSGRGTFQVSKAPTCFLRYPRSWVQLFK